MRSLAQARTVALGVVLTCLVAGLLAAAPAVAALELSEILADPASDWSGDGTLSYRDDEWIEVTNTGPEAVDLDEYYVRDALGDEAHVQLFGILAAGESAAFYGYNAVTWQQAVGATVTGLSLNNSGDTVELWLGDPVSPGAVLVDSYTYAAHETVDDRASGRLHPGGEWALFDGLNPYDGDTLPPGSGCLPSPGVVNDCVPGGVPVEAASWGHIKADYR